MSQTALQVLVGTALTDSEFRHDLLNGSRRTLLMKFDLTDEERKAVLGVEAESIQQFAAQLCEWLECQKRLTFRSPTSVALPYPPRQSPVGSAFWQGDKNL
jgi:hypothetical protein